MDLLLMAVCEKLRQVGIVSRTSAAVLYAMVENGLSYEEARDTYAEFAGRAPEQVQSDLCYDVLRAGFDGMPAQIFAELRGEVSGIEN